MPPSMQWVSSFWKWSMGISVWSCALTHTCLLPCRGFHCFWRWSMGISVWCVCTNTHASFYAEVFNVFKDKALKYMFDACALPPMPPSMQRVQCFWRWSIGISVWCMCTNTHASFYAVGFNVYEGEEVEYLFDVCALTPIPPFMQKVSICFKV